MIGEQAEYATRIVSEENPVKAWACCYAGKHALSEYKSGEPLEDILGYISPQVMPWDDSSLAVGYFNLWGQIRERQPQSGPTTWDYAEWLPYYIAQFGYPESLWVFDPELAVPLEHAFDFECSTQFGARPRPARGSVFVHSVEWVDLVLRPGYGQRAAAITEDVGPGWQPAQGLHIHWLGFRLWRKPSIVRRVRRDDGEPLDPGLVHYDLRGVADIGQAGSRPVLIYEPWDDPTAKEMRLRKVMKYFLQPHEHGEVIWLK